MSTSITTPRLRLDQPAKRPDRRGPLTGTEAGETKEGVRETGGAKGTEAADSNPERDRAA